MILQVDAFIDDSRGMIGNPAGVCVLSNEFYTRDEMQKIAGSYNFSETCFIVKYVGSKEQLQNIRKLWPHHKIFGSENHQLMSGNSFFIRWFSPKDEAPLCGHATLAACHVIFSNHMQDNAEDNVNIIFSDGCIEAASDNETGLISITMPSKNFSKYYMNPELYLGIDGSDVIDVMSDGIVCFFVVNNENVVAKCVPNHKFIMQTDLRAIAVTSVSSDDDIDFCSRYFAPSVGIYEDPVCGSLHCRLAKYWSQKLRKRKMIAKQLSQRGGILYVEHKDDCVVLCGRCRLIQEFLQ